MLEKFLKERAKKLGIPEEVLRELLPKAPEVGLKVIELVQKYDIPKEIIEKALKEKDPEAFLKRWIEKRKKPALKGK